VTGDLLTQFHSDVRDEVIKHLPHDKTNREVVGALQAMQLDELVVRFYNWLGRMVHPHARTVTKSPEYVTTLSGLQRPVADSLEQLAEKIERGDDVSPHLSKQVRLGFDLTKQGRNLGRRGDLDLLLNDWGIHHLHPSPEIEADGFVRRDDLLLFAIFSEDTAYLLDVMPHGRWTDEHLVQVAVRNWPDRGLFIQLAGAVGLAQSEHIGPQERTRLRSAGVHTLLEVDGRVYLSQTMGLMTSGVSGAASTKGMLLLRTLENVSARLTHDPDDVRPQIERLAGHFPSDPEFHVIFASAPKGFAFAIREERTGVPLLLPV
jgi:hypothetical protein